MSVTVRFRLVTSQPIIGLFSQTLTISPHIVSDRFVLLCSVLAASCRPRQQPFPSSNPFRPMIDNNSGFSMDRCGSVGLCTQREVSSVSALNSCHAALEPLRRCKRVSRFGFEDSWSLQYAVIAI